MSRGPGRGGGARRLGTCLPEHLSRALSSRVGEDSRLRQAWHGCVSEPLASHVRPVRYTAGLLFVHVDTPAWASRLRHQQPALVTALRRVPAFRDLADLRVRVVPRESSSPAVKTAPRSPSRLSAEAAKAVAQAARTIDNPGLRAALERLAQASGGPRPPKPRRP